MVMYPSIKPQVCIGEPISHRAHYALTNIFGTRDVSDTLFPWDLFQALGFGWH
jgi:hypothetical protein